VAAAITAGITAAVAPHPAEVVARGRRGRTDGYAACETVDASDIYFRMLQARPGSVKDPVWSAARGRQGEAHGD
jgi:hypothetical protein